VDSIGGTNKLLMASSSSSKAAFYNSYLQMAAVMDEKTSKETGHSLRKLRLSVSYLDRFHLVSSLKCESYEHKSLGMFLVHLFSALWMQRESGLPTRSKNR